VSARRWRRESGTRQPSAGLGQQSLVLAGAPLVDGGVPGSAQPLLRKRGDLRVTADLVTATIRAEFSG
jgi:hypothetical protein